MAICHPIAYTDDLWASNNDHYNYNKDSDNDKENKNNDTDDNNNDGTEKSSADKADGRYRNSG
jgi:hypothetical protein